MSVDNQPGKTGHPWAPLRERSFTDGFDFRFFAVSGCSRAWTACWGGSAQCVLPHPTLPLLSWGERAQLPDSHPGGGEQGGCPSLGRGLQDQPLPGSSRRGDPPCSSRPSCAVNPSEQSIAARSSLGLGSSSAHGLAARNAGLRPQAEGTVAGSAGPAPGTTPAGTGPGVPDGRTDGRTDRRLLQAPPSHPQPWGSRTQAGAGGRGHGPAGPHKAGNRGCLSASEGAQCKDVLYFVCFLIVCVFTMSKYGFYRFSMISFMESALEV